MFFLLGPATPSGFFCFFDLKIFGFGFFFHNPQTDPQSTPQFRWSNRSDKSRKNGSRQTDDDSEPNHTTHSSLEDEIQSARLLKLEQKLLALMTQTGHSVFAFVSSLKMATTIGHLLKL